MEKPHRETLVLEPIADDPEVVRWLAAMQDARGKTMRELEIVVPGMLDWHPDAPLNTIGTLLYHIALIEASWLLEDILEGEPGPESLQALPSVRGSGRRRSADPGGR